MRLKYVKIHYDLPMWTDRHEQKNIRVLSFKIESQKHYCKTVLQ